MRTTARRALSLRDLARQAGVSHAAPRRHFADRQALLDALAETGFARMGEEMHVAIEGAGEDCGAQLRAMAGAYVSFAATDGALLDLMFGAKAATRSAGVRAAFERLFTEFGALVRQWQRRGALPPGDPERLRLLLIATLQGIASLVASDRVQAAQADALITDAVALFTPGRHP